MDVVTKKGKLTIRNPKATSIKCEIVYALRVSLILFLFARVKINNNSQGHLEKSKPAAKEATEGPSTGQELNPISKLLWELEVPAGGLAELTFEYGVKASK